MYLPHQNQIKDNSRTVETLNNYFIFIYGLKKKFGSRNKRFTCRNYRSWVLSTVVKLGCKNSTFSYGT